MVHYKLAFGSATQIMIGGYSTVTGTFAVAVTFAVAATVVVAVTVAATVAAEEPESIIWRALRMSEGLGLALAIAPGSG